MMAYHNLAERVFSSRQRITGTTTLGHTYEGRPTNYKQYDRSKLARAIVAVTEGNMSTRRAAVEYGIPQSTLSDNVRGRVLFGTSSGQGVSEQ